MRSYIDKIIDEQIHGMVNKIISESKLYEFMESDEGSSERKDKEDDKKKNDDEKDSNELKIRKKALKKGGGVRSDFNVEDEKKYNANVGDMDQSDIENQLKNGFINITAVAKKLYPDHTDTGAESQLRKKINHEESDSGSIYKLKAKELKRLKSILATYLNVK